MSKTRTKKVAEIVTLEDFQIAQYEHATASTRSREILADIDRRVAEIREEYAEEMRQLQKLEEDNFAIVQRYCEQNKEILFDAKKSIEGLHGTIGFRKGMPTLKTMKGFTWEKVLALLPAARMGKFIRIKKEVDKVALLNAREKSAVAKKMPLIGVEVVQQETFFIDIKTEEPEIV